MDAGTLRGLVTLVVFLAFIGVVIWAYSRRRTKDFEEAARLPLEDDTAPPEEDRDSGRRES